MPDMPDQPLPVIPDDAHGPRGSSRPLDPAVRVLTRITVWVGDLTDPPADLGVDAIVNAANPQLAGGGGVDGAIHRAAGADELQAYTRAHYPDGCATGLCVATPAFGLEAKGIRRILHAVGPVWDPTCEFEDAKLGDTRSDNLLASCYTRCLDACATEDLRCLAFPGISTGVFGFPKPRAARIAFAHVHGHLMRHNTPERVVLCCFNEQDAEVMREAVETRDRWMYARTRV